MRKIHDQICRCHHISVLRWPQNRCNCRRQKDVVHDMIVLSDGVAYRAACTARASSVRVTFCISIVRVPWWSRPLQGFLFCDSIFCERRNVWSIFCESFAHSTFICWNQRELSSWNLRVAMEAGWKSTCRYDLLVGGRIAVAMAFFRPLSPSRRQRQPIFAVICLRNRGCFVVKLFQAMEAMFRSARPVFCITKSRTLTSNFN